MTDREPCIIALGGGGFSMEPDEPRLDDYILSHARRSPARVCFLPTASGDSNDYVVRFYEAFPATRCIATHLPLFRRTHPDLRAHVLAQDVIYVGGGNTANMLAVWRAHGLDAILREAWSSGVVLCGLSAGSLCWYEGGVTDSFGPSLAPIADGLGLLAGSHCPHYDGEAERRPAYHRAVASGALPAGIAADDGVALRYQGTELVEVVSSRPEARAWRVTRRGDDAHEEAIVPRLLEHG